MKGGDGKKEISREEVKRVIEMLKDGKAAEMDGNLNEVWRYGREIREWVRHFCNRVWKGKGWPEEWKKGVIVPIIKKGEGAMVENY